MCPPLWSLPSTTPLDRGFFPYFRVLVVLGDFKSFSFHCTSELILGPLHTWAKGRNNVIVGALDSHLKIHWHGLMEFASDLKPWNTLYSLPCRLFIHNNGPLGLHLYSMKWSWTCSTISTNEGDLRLQWAHAFNVMCEAVLSCYLKEVVKNYHLLSDFQLNFIHPWQCFN